MGNIVIGVDSSTQSTKAIAWDRQGKVLAEGRCDIPLSNPSLEKFEQNVEDWWNAFCVSCKELSNHIKMSEVDGLAISNQRETLAKLDEDGKAIYPATVWMDKRSVQEVEDLNSGLKDTVKAVAEELEIKPALINKAIKIAHKGEWHKYSDDFDSLENLIIAVGRDK